MKEEMMKIPNLTIIEESVDNLIMESDLPTHIKSSNGAHIGSRVAGITVGR